MISTVLVANRGEIASRIFRTCRERGLRTVAVYAEPDAGLPFVREADLAVALGGTTAADSYLVVEKIIDAARRAGADAVHPGFGFLSENAAFARAVLDAGLTWIGPTPENIAAMGTKVEAKERAAAAGVPVLPSAVASGNDPETWSEAAESVGYPVLVKASSGGGGRGMRIVRTPMELADAVVGARREALASFGDGTVFIERYLETPRHIELQVFGDNEGNVIHLGERECSIQRRHQKIVEEAPSAALDPDTRALMGDAAAALAKAIGYVGAGTVEFLYDGSDAERGTEFFFLEMNTRLQVEHPVTECVTGLDLVGLQIDVANGHPLPLTQAQAETRRHGHAIEVRLYAEDPAADFRPTFGALQAYVPGVAMPGVRFENGVESGSIVTTSFDPMIAKVVAWAPTRDQAAALLAHQLAGMEIHGVRTNRDYLVSLLRTPAFLAARTTTAFVDEHPELLVPAGTLPVEQRLPHLVAAVVAGSLHRRGTDRLWGFGTAGFRNLPSEPLRVTYAAVDGTSTPVEYRWDEFDRSRLTVCAQIDGAAVDAAVRVISCRPAAAAVELTLEIDGITRTQRATVDGTHVWVNTPDGQTRWEERPRFEEPALGGGAHGPIAPVPGRVVAVHVQAGQSVTAGDLLVVMEAMKMEHRIEAAADAVIDEVLCGVGDQVDAHQTLVSFHS